MTVKTPTEIPAGPANRAQRAVLMALVSDTKKLHRTLAAMRDLAAEQMAALVAGNAPRADQFGGGAFGREADTVATLRAKLDVRAEDAHAYGLTKEQVDYAIAVAASGDNDAETTWLFSATL